MSPVKRERVCIPVELHPDGTPTGNPQCVTQNGKQSHPRRTIPLNAAAGDDRKGSIGDGAHAGATFGPLSRRQLGGLLTCLACAQPGTPGSMAAFALEATRLLPPARDAHAHLPMGRLLAASPQSSTRRSRNRSSHPIQWRNEWARCHLLKDFRTDGISSRSLSL